MSKATRAPTFLNPDEDGIMGQSGMDSFPFPFVNKAGRHFNGALGPSFLLERAGD